ncbi:uncharacterized protein LOC110818357 isoform X2 [Carica papaya]|uniref:uncharacterized protein LOC110818357 isoform X2 n=1 Tax=Carica papaya TaxID=3649 RepID=UPI000B8CD94E|nr:uncharacterized protein LOC110818357 isoform X2 [Carica papaya]
MKALKSFCTNKHLLLFNLAIKTPVSFSFSSRQNLVFPRHFHVTSLRFRVEDSSLAAIGSFNNEPDLSRSGHGNENSAGVGSVYNPVAGETFTRPCINRNGGQEFDRSSWSSGSWVDDFQRTRASGSVKKANASNRGNTDADTSDAYNWIDNFEGEETYGRVRGENLTAGDDIRLGSSSSDDGTNDLFKEKANKGVKKANSSSVSWHEFRLGGIVRNKKKVKEKVSWVCTECGHSEGQWWGSCRECNSVGTVKQFTEASESGDNGKGRGLEFSANAVRSWLPQQATDVQPRRLTDINRGLNQLEWRIPLSGYFGCEVARVLGGGLVPGSLVLIGGDPGVGKSTLLLQIAAIVAEGSNLGRPAPVLYVSGEESVEQIGNRADRMSITTEELFLYSSTDIEDILKKVQLISPRALIIDSIQTVYLKEVSGSAGGISQVKECTLALLCFAKKTNIPVLLVGHVTKSGEIAGPRALEHIVDAVLYMEGEENSSYRLLRPVKNRFGSTDECPINFKQGEK